MTLAMRPTRHLSAAVNVNNSQQSLNLITPSTRVDQLTWKQSSHIYRTGYRHSGKNYAHTIL